MLIVLADKDPYDLQALQSALVGPDREVVIVEDGDNVITLAQSRSPDVVIMCSSLGQMGGLAVSRDLKMLAETGQIKEPKVIILLERVADEWLANWSRCDAFLCKPVEAEEVDHVLRGLVAQPV